MKDDSKHSWDMWREKLVDVGQKIAMSMGVSVDTAVSTLASVANADVASATMDKAMKMIGQVDTSTIGHTSLILHNNVECYNLYEHLQKAIGTLNCRHRSKPSLLNMESHRKVMEALEEDRDYDVVIDSIWSDYSTREAAKKAVDKVMEYLDGIHDDRQNELNQIVNKLLMCLETEKQYMAALWQPSNSSIIFEQTFPQGTFDELWLFWGVLGHLLFDRIPAKQIFFRCKNIYNDEHITASLDLKSIRKDGKDAFEVCGKFMNRNSLTPAGYSKTRNVGWKLNDQN